MAQIKPVHNRMKANPASVSGAGTAGSNPTVGAFAVADSTATDMLLEIPYAANEPVYRIQRSLNGVDYTDYAAIPTNIFIANGLTPSTMYWWRYRTEDDFGTPTSAWSQSVSAATQAAIVARRLPNFPQSFASIKYIPIGTGGRTGTIRTVGTGKTYSTTQAAIDAAARGDTIRIDAGYDGGDILLRNKAGTDPIYIEVADTSPLPAFGTGGWVTPSHVAYLARVSGGTSNVPIIRAEDGASDYRLVGLHVQVSDAISFLNNLTEFTPAKSDLSLFARRIVFDRCWLNCVDAKNCVRASWFDVTEGGMVQCYLSGFKNIGQDTQAVIVVGTPGPQRYHRCYIEGAAENFMAGGTNANIVGVQPADLTFTECEFGKPTWWVEPQYTFGSRYTVKNNFELKSGERILVHRCTMRNQWLAGQGHSIVITTRTEGGASHWYSVKDLIFTDMLAIDVYHLFNAHAMDDVLAQQSGESTRRILMRNVLWIQRDWRDSVNDWMSGAFRGIQILGGPDTTDFLDLQFEHITMVDPYLHMEPALDVVDGKYNSYMTFFGDVGQSDRLTMRNNILMVWGTSGNHWNGIGTGLAQFASYDIQKNIVGTKPQGSNPSNNFYITNRSQIGYVDYQGGNFQLASNSPYKAQGYAGRDPGAIFDRLPSFTFPPTADTTKPTFSGGISITNISATGCTAGWSEATDNVGINRYAWSVLWLNGSSWEHTGQRGTVATGVTSVNITGLVGGRTHRVFVWAVDTTNNHRLQISDAFVTA